MNKFVENLGLENCLKLQIGRTKILLDDFENFYSGGFGSNNIILENKGKYFSMGYCLNNKIVADLKQLDIEVENLETYIRERVYERVLSGLFDYVEENKNKQLFDKSNISLFYNYSNFGTNPITKMREKIEISLDFSKLIDDEIIISYVEVEKNKLSYLKYNLSSDKFYVDDKMFMDNQEIDKIVMKCFTSSYDRNEYVLFHNYINNKLKGEDIAYKELADLNKWLKDKVNILVVYTDETGEEKEGKVKANLDSMLSDLSKDYYEEMFSFYGVNEIKSIKQIKGFKYRNDFYPLNVENLLYKKGDK